MLKIKLLLLYSVILLLGGCGVPNYYVLSTASQPVTSYGNIEGAIGVEKVRVPKYLFKREIAVAKSASQVMFLDGANWAEEIDEGLTRRLVSFLQKKFNQPEVYQYPWDMDTQPYLKVSVQISRFIAQEGRVYLDASIQLENMQSGKHKAKLFTTSVPSGSDDTLIVTAMDKAFTILESQLAMEIRKF